MDAAKMLRMGKKFLIDPDYRFLLKSSVGFYDSMPDEEYLKRKFKAVMGYELDLDNPKTFNEKLQWLKLHDRRAEYTTMVDKYAVKKWVSEKIGEQYIIPVLGVWDKYEDIDFDSLPDQFVLKCTHDSGGIVICRGKNKFDAKAAKKKINKALHRNYYYLGREWPYKNVKPKVMAEKYMTEKEKNEIKDYKIFNFENERLLDYKFMCFDGKVRCLFVCTERGSAGGLKVTWFDTKWNILPFERHYPKSNTKILRPSFLDEMIDLAERLSKGIPFVRVDFYEIDGHIYFGEYTFYPGNGIEEFRPEEVDLYMGQMIELPKE